MMYFNKLSIMALFMNNALTASAFMRGSLHDFKDEDGSLFAKSLLAPMAAAGRRGDEKIPAAIAHGRSDQATDCVDTQVAVSATAEPAVMTLNEEEVYVFDLLDDTKAAIGILAYSPTVEFADDDGTCYKKYGWYLYEWAEDDAVYTYGPCDGSGFFYEDFFIEGTGKFACATGSIVVTEGSDYHIYDIAVCNDCS